jgi:Leucine-rich repeat (LRR) protein
MAAEAVERDGELVLRECGADEVKRALGPDVLNNLRTLTSLDLSRNQLAALPPAVAWASALPQLRVLDLSHNALTDLPAALPPTLVHLALQHNQLATLPAAVFTLPALTKLAVGGNRLTQLSGPFHELRALRMLYAGCNAIASVDDSLAAVAGTLEVLYLGGNRLRAVPRVVAALQRVTVLHLSDNQLTSLPDTLGGLHELTVLHVHRNQLRTLPVELLALRRLRQLSVRDNPLVATFADACAVMVPSLRDLAARACHQQMATDPALADTWHRRLPRELWAYLQSAHACSSCNAVCFGQSRDSQIEFLDLCGQYHVPFSRYLCSTACARGGGDDANEGAAAQSRDAVGCVVRLRRVLLNRYAPGSAPSLAELREEAIRADQEQAEWSV